MVAKGKEVAIRETGGTRLVQGASLRNANDAPPVAAPSRVVQRHGNATDTCRHYGWSTMTLHRLENDPKSDFPQPSEVMSNLKVRNWDEIDAWLQTKKKKKPTTTASS